MDMRANAMVIVAVLTLASPVDVDRLVALLDLRLPARFRERIVESWLGAAQWMPDPSFDPRAHVHRVERGSRSLESIVGEVMDKRLPRSRPLWDIHLVGGEPEALLFRAHHAMADGARLLEVLATLADEGPAQRPTPAPRPHPDIGLGRRVWAMLQGARGAAALVLRRRDPDSPLHVRLAGRKRVAISEAVDLERVMTRAHDEGGTTMAHMLAAVAEALRRSLSPWRGATLHALVPVPTAAPGEAGNRFASVFVPLPLGESAHGARVRAIDRGLARARRRAPGAARIIEAAGAAVAAIERLGVRRLSRAASLMVSNVRGPEQRIHLASVEVTNMAAFAPSAGRISMAVTFMSYAGQLRAAVAMDERVIADPHAFAAELTKQLEQLSH